MRGPEAPRRYAGGVARPADRLPEKAPGDLFVDVSGIDCDLCRLLAPATFARSDRRGLSYVARQPGDDLALGRALRALVTCPTASIGAAQRRGVREAARAFPEPVAGEVSFCGVRVD